MKQSVSERIQLARNPSTPVDVLRQLAMDTDRSVRERVVNNVSTPEDILAQLATDTDSWIRWRVALHPSLPLDSDTFQDLMVDPDPDVRAVTMKRLANHLTENHKSKL
jgi:hypothetical protein